LDGATKKRRALIAEGATYLTVILTLDASEISPGNREEVTSGARLVLKGAPCVASGFGKLQDRRG